MYKLTIFPADSHPSNLQGKAGAREAEIEITMVHIRAAAIIMCSRIVNQEKVPVCPRLLVLIDPPSCCLQLN